MKTRLISLISVVLAIVVLTVSIMTVEPKVVEATTEEPQQEKVVSSPQIPEEPAPVVEESPWHFFNLDLQGDGIEGNEYNFGAGGFGSVHTPSP